MMERGAKHVWALLERRGSVLSQQKRYSCPSDSKVFHFFPLQPSLLVFHEHLCSLALPSKWNVQLCEESIELQLVELCRQKSHECEPIVITRSMIISQDLTWMVHVQGHMLNPLYCTATADIPSKLDLNSFKRLTAVLTASNICVGNPDGRFVDMAKSREGKFLSASNEVVSVLDSGRCVTVGSVSHSSTIRHCQCELLVMTSSPRCKCCSKYRNNLRAMYSNHCKEKTANVSGANLRYMQASQKERRIRALKNALRNKQRRLERIKVKLQAITKQSSVQIDDDLLNGLRGVVDGNQDNINKLAADDFKRVFWQQQVNYNY